MEKVLSKKFENYDQYLNFVAPVLKKYLQKNLDDVIATFEDTKHSDVNKYLYDPIRNYTKNAGKLHRPLTCIAAYLAVIGGDVTHISDVLVVACAIENFQTAALIHDDIADGGKLRRGELCMHITQGEGIAINAGDYGLACTVGGVVEALRNSNYSDKKILDIVRQLVFMEYMTIEGQAMDLGWARDNRFDISEDDYICMATKKSAYYSASIPCVLGAYCADASEDVCKALEVFGKKIGVAFQIQDDLLNLIETDESKNVKDFRNDITEGKRTLVVCKTLELAEANEKNELIEILQSKTSDDNKLERAVEIMQNCGAIEYAKSKASDLSTQAVRLIENMLPANQWSNILIDMANWVNFRKC